MRYSSGPLLALFGLFVVNQADAADGFAWPVVAEPDVYPHASAKITTGAIDPAPTPLADAVSQTLATLDDGDVSDEEAAEFAALDAFYKKRNGDLLWLTSSGLNNNAHAVIKELANAHSWGLDPAAFKYDFPASPDQELAEQQQAKHEIALTRTILLYARYARGGRIMAPSKMLNSHLNRTPQLLAPEDVLNGLAEPGDVAAFLTSLHPKHEQFRRLRWAYLAAGSSKRLRFRLKPGESLNLGLRDPRLRRLRKRLGLSLPVNDDDANLFTPQLQAALRTFQDDHGVVPADGSLDADTARALNKPVSVPKAKLQANMEMWRWMWDDLGELHVMANVPEFMLTLKKNGETLYRERTVVGQVSKKTSIFTRTLKHIVLRPMWRVPESIKVRELWPSLKTGGGLMRQYRLELETKDGKPRNWRRMNWAKEDIRNYEVIQRPGRHSVMGKVKFSFPSQHTIFIHDTPDKYMFRSKRRTFSHGCLRLRNPVKLAKLLLKEDKGWDADQVDDMIASGPNRNAIKMETRIPMHIVYFTAWVDDDGRLKSYSDIYGHEKRVRQALAGQWNRIAKGRNHLAPPQPIASRRGNGSWTANRARKRSTRPSDFVNRAISGGFF